MELTKREELTKCVGWQTRAASARLLKAFCGGTAHDYEDYKGEMIKMLVHLFGDPTPAVTTPLRTLLVFAFF